MGWFVLVVVIAGCGGGVMLNHRNAGAAMSGVQFHLDATPKAVGDAVLAAYCGGKKSALKMMVMRLTVKARGNGTFDVHSSIGDVGRIVVQADGPGTVVKAFTRLRSSPGGR